MRLKNLIFKLVTCALTILLLLAGVAHAVNIPVNSVVNPLTQTLYVPYATVNSAGNPTSYFKYYDRTANGWQLTSSKYLVSYTRPYGLAVAENGSFIVTSVSGTYLDKLRLYVLINSLNSNGSPGGSYSLVAIPNTDEYYIRGIALANSDTRIYVIGAGKVHYLDKNNNGDWVYSTNDNNPFNEGIEALANLQDIAVTPAMLDKDGNTTYKIFVSRRTSPDNAGNIFVYKYIRYKNTNPIQETFALIDTKENIDSPTFLKVVDNRLFVAANGTDGKSVYIYDITENGITHVADVSCVSSGSPYGNPLWTGFDVSPDGKTLHFTHQADGQAVLRYTKALYDQNGAFIGKDETFDDEQIGCAKGDSLVVAPDNGHLAIGYSGDGTKCDSEINIDNTSPGPDYIKPEITSVSPEKVVKGTDNTLKITGKYFLSNSDVYLTGANPNPDTASWGSFNWVKLTIDPESLSTTNIEASITKENIEEILKPEYVDADNGDLENFKTVVVKNGNVYDVKLNALEIIDPTPPVVNNPPEIVPPLSQYGQRSDGTLDSLPVSAISKYNDMTFKFGMTDPDATAENPVLLTPQVKLLYPDLSEAVLSGEAIEYTGGAPVIGMVEVTKLKNGTYKWSGRVKENAHLYSDWVAFGSRSSFKVQLDTAAPQVANKTPTGNGVAIDAAIEITFSEPMDKTSLQIELLDENSSDPLDIVYEQLWTENNTKVKLNHNNFANDAEHTFRILAAKDEVGNTLQNLPYVWYFTTIQNQPPQAFNLIAPDDGEIVSDTPALKWEPSVDPDGNAVTYFLILTAGGTQIPEISVGENTEYAINLNNYLPPSKGKSVTYTWKVKASDGNLAINSNQTSSFIAIANETYPDNPQVITALPESGEPDIYLNDDVVVTFSEPMKKGSFSIKGLNAPITDTIWSNNQTQITIKHSNWQPLTTYTLEITAADVYGNKIAGNFYNWSFTTGDENEILLPTATETYPADNATGVAVDLSESGLNGVNGIVITFDQPMQHEGPWQFYEDFTCSYLDENGAGQMADIDLQAIYWEEADGQANRRLIFPLIQGATLYPGKEHQFHLKTAKVADLNGNPLANNPAYPKEQYGNVYIWKFTPGGGIGEKNFNFSYISETQAENWISIPYESAEGSGNISITNTDQLVDSLNTVFGVQDGDLITILGWDNASQVPVGPIQYMYFLGMWDSGGQAPISLQTGHFYKITISNLEREAQQNTFSAAWDTSGTIPDTVSFYFSYLSETQAENWISLPANMENLTNTDQLVDSLDTVFDAQDEDLITILGWDNASQVPVGPIQYMYFFGMWDSGGQEPIPTAVGDALVINLSNQSREQTFNVLWPE